MGLLLLDVWQCAPTHSSLAILTPQGYNKELHLHSALFPSSPSLLPVLPVPAQPVLPASGAALPPSLTDQTQGHSPQPH